jgi:hypothetical protein
VGCKDMGAPAARGNPPDAADLLAALDAEAGGEE